MNKGLITDEINRSCNRVWCFIQRLQFKSIAGQNRGSVYLFIVYFNVTVWMCLFRHRVEVGHPDVRSGAPDYAGGTGPVSVCRYAAARTPSRRVILHLICVVFKVGAVQFQESAEIRLTAQTSSTVSRCSCRTRKRRASSWSERSGATPRRTQPSFWSSTTRWVSGTRPPARRTRVFVLAQNS